ncbi:MAG: Bacterial ribosome maturation protein RimP [Firmicutes bacterium]|nr:Bacterial ribosome maturation protein RimP [Bacillota bacterium]
MAKEVVKHIEDLIAPILEEIGIELLEIEYRKEHGDQMLRIFIDREEGVDLNTCTQATRAVQDMIGQENIEYDHLEMSSPGFNRLLKKEKDFIRFQGERIKVRTLQPLEGQKNFLGRLGDVNQKVLHLEIDGQKITIPRDIISIVRLDPEI